MTDSYRFNQMVVKIILLNHGLIQNLVINIDYQMLVTDTYFYQIPHPFCTLSLMEYYILYAKNFKQHENWKKMKGKLKELCLITKKFKTLSIKK